MSPYVIPLIALALFLLGSCLFNLLQASRIRALKRQFHETDDEAKSLQSPLEAKESELEVPHKLSLDLNYKTLDLYGRNDPDLYGIHDQATLSVVYRTGPGSKLLYTSGPAPGLPFEIKQSWRYRLSYVVDEADRASRVWVYSPRNPSPEAETTPLGESSCTNLSEPTVSSPLSDDPSGSQAPCTDLPEFKQLEAKVQEHEERLLEVEGQVDYILSSTNL